MGLDSTARVVALAAALATAAAGTLALTGPASVEAAPNPACKVANTTRGGSYDRLSTAVRKARNGDRLVVKGTCKGRTTIVNKRLTIEGLWTKYRGAPTLRSNLNGPVLTVTGGEAALTLSKLTIRGDPESTVTYSGAGLKIGDIDRSVRLFDVRIRDLKTKQSGGGILIDGATVILKGHTVVKGCAARTGGGIANLDGKLVLGGATRIQFNRSLREGGGVLSSGNFATLSLRFESAVSHNRAGTRGGGIWANHGKVTLDGRSRVDHNAAEEGGGLTTSGVLLLKGSAVVRDNTASANGGGVAFSGSRMTMQGASRISGNSAWYAGGLDSRESSTLVGVLCAPASGANVFGNSPDDCHKG